MITIKTFAQIREISGDSDLSLPLPENCTTVAGLKAHLATRSSAWEQALSAGVLCAVNQSLGDETSAVNDGDEVAFFPPVTGG
ncbi:MAG: molybdopterin converting factor subunit 1 [Pseudomonadota bacterium]|nr:molybdopterin converting factor subunit 1 [Pseudomonadota bacterium]